MAEWVAPQCGCTQVVYAGQRRERLCEHGNLYLSVRAGRPRPALARTEPKRYWVDARAKCDDEGCCRICKRSDRHLEGAHILGREHDEPRISESTGEILSELYVHPDRVIPACGPVPDGCHGDIEMRRVSLLPYLTLTEQLQAVRDAGGIEAARIRLAPVEHREEVERSAA